MQAVFRRIQTAAQPIRPCFIGGESGTGKELVPGRSTSTGPARREKPSSRSIARRWQRACWKAKLFGHEKGAFTQAVKMETRSFEIAMAVTLFLDEIGESTPAMQVKLLARSCRNGKFRAGRGNPLDRGRCRLVAATNRNLPDRIREGAIPRRSVYYRLNVVVPI